MPPLSKRASPSSTICAALLAAALPASLAQAQTQLPGITVTTPSPVARTAPSGPSAPGPAVTPLAPLPGQIIVEDAFVP